MPQSNEILHDFDLKADMRSYYRGSIATYLSAPDKDGNVVRSAAYIEDFGGNHRAMTATIRTLPREAGTGWGNAFAVPVAHLEFTLPALGLVQVENEWYHLSRHPARRMRKGYHPETIQAACLDGRNYRHHCDVSDYEVVRQVWYGNPLRITCNIVVWEQDIFYAIDKVASLDAEGNVSLIPNKEKLGEFVCKALANNWDLATSKCSVRTLPSSPQTLLV